MFRDLLREGGEETRNAEFQKEMGGVTNPEPEYIEDKENVSYYINLSIFDPQSQYRRNFHYTF